MQISALVIARNEERNISKCLESLKFADETVVILDRSSDRTEEFSKIYTKKIFSGNWIYEGDRRNFGITKCSYEWILEIDADEIISKELAKEIKVKINQKKYDYFYINLINYVYNKKIVGGWMACLAPDGKFCLFRRKNKIWSNKKVHPDYRIFGKKGKEFKNSIVLQDYLLNYKNKLIRNIFIFDYFHNKKSQEIKIAFRLVFQDINQTITEVQIKNVMNDIIEHTTKIEGVSIPGLN